LIAVSITALLLTAISGSPASAESSATAPTVSLESKSIAFGLGFSWGVGKLRYAGQDFFFSADGVTFMDFGVSKANAAGEVYNLSELAKFEGTYFAIEASFALGGGLGAMTLRNQDGVILRLNSISEGARFQLGSSGLKIKFW
jgi:hypothetical protein